MECTLQCTQKQAELFICISPLSSTGQYYDLLARQSFSTNSTPGPFPPDSLNSTDQDSIAELPQNFSLFIVFKAVPLSSFHFVSVYTVSYKDVLLGRSSNVTDSSETAFVNSTSNGNESSSHSKNRHSNHSNDQPSDHSDHRSGNHSDDFSGSHTSPNYTNNSRGQQDTQPWYKLFSTLTLGPDVNVIYRDGDYRTISSNIIENRLEFANETQMSLLLTVNGGKISSCLNGVPLSEGIVFWNASVEDQVLLVFEEDMYLNKFQVCALLHKGVRHVITMRVSLCVCMCFLVCVCF